MKMNIRLALTLWLVLLVMAAACQSSNATPTLQPGEVEIPFEIVVLDEVGEAQKTDGPQLFAVTDRVAAAQLEPWLSTAAVQQLDQVDWKVDSLLALFRLWGGCSGFGVTVERLTRQGNTLTVHAFDWRPAGEGACAQTSRSAYHLIRVRKADANLDELELVLRIEGKERGPSRAS